MDATTTTTPTTTGATVLITTGFAANMTGTVEAVQYGPNLGWRILVNLVGYGPRWFTENFIQPYEG